MPGYGDHAGPGGYEDAAYDPNLPPYTGEEHEFYDDIPPPRRRMGVLAIAAVFALAVVGTAGAFGYRALFGSASSGPPPVIKADSKPVKIVPDKDKNQSAKLINDRVNERSGDQKLVSREEQPVDLNKGKPAGMLTQGQSVASAGRCAAGAGQRRHRQRSEEDPHHHHPSRPGRRGGRRHGRAAAGQCRRRNAGAAGARATDGPRSDEAADSRTHAGAASDRHPSSGARHRTGSPPLPTMRRSP